MKTKGQNFLFGAALALCSVAAAGMTTYYILNHAQESSSTESTRSESSFAMPVVFGNGGPREVVDLTAAADASVHAVVHIKSTQHSKVQTVDVPQMPDLFEYFFGNPYGNGQRRQQQVQTQPRVGFGSGVIISTDGYIVTNNHVIEGADEIDVKLNDNREFKGRLVGADPDTDLALVKIEGDEFPILPIGNSDELKVGEWVLAVGNPFNLTSTVTAGIVSAKARQLGVYGRQGGIESFIQTDAAINQGNSGGALVNVRGELVGINAVLSSPTGSYAGYGFAIPTTIVTKVVSDLKEYGTVQRAILGIKGMDVANVPSMDDKALAEMGVEKGDITAKEGVLVSEIIDEGSAFDTDLKVGDVIVAIDGKKVRTMAELQETMAQHRPGDTITLKTMRGKKEYVFDVLLKNPQGNTEVVKNADFDVLGAAFREADEATRKQLNIGYGLQVTGVSKGLFADAGIKKGFVVLKVNGAQMRTEDDIREAVRVASQSSDRVLFIIGVYPSGKRCSYAIDLTE